MPREHVVQPAAVALAGAGLLPGKGVARAGDALTVLPLGLPALLFLQEGEAVRVLRALTAGSSGRRRAPRLLRRLVVVV